jgi:hypothetical protein
MVEKINTGVKTIGEASKLALAELLLKAAKNPKSEITMEDYNNYIKTGKLNFASGGMANINDMTRPVGYEKGGNVITRRLASTRAQKPFENFLRDIGFTKKDETTGKIRGAKGDWAKYLTSKNIKVGTVEATDELNKLLKAAGKPLYVDISSAGKNFSEEIISAVTGTQPGESGAREARNAANSKIVEIKKIATQAEGANSTKAKQKLLTSLFEKSFPVLKTVPKYAALLSTAVASKAFGYIPIATKMGDAELPKESMMDKTNMDFSGPSASSQLLEQMSQDAVMKKGGGMMNMNEMIRPLGYEEGGDVGSFAEQRSLLDRISNFFKYQRRDPERFFGGSDGMEFHLDDPSIIQFIKRRAGTDDENSPEYQNELMKFMEEVTPKKNMGGIISLAGSK